MVKTPKRVAVVGFLAGLLVAQVVGYFFPAEIWVSALKWKLENWTFTGLPTCDDTAWLTRVHAKKPEAADYRAPAGIFTYVATNTVDDDLTTAWLLPGTNDPNQREISWTLHTKSKIDLICIRNGYAKDKKTYTGNERVKKGTFSAEGGRCATAVDFEDKVDPADNRLVLPGWNDFQTVRYSCRSNLIRFVVDDTYPANDDDSYVGLTDIQFWKACWFACRQ